MELRSYITILYQVTIAKLIENLINSYVASYACSSSI